MFRLISGLLTLFVLKKFGVFAECLRYALPQFIGRPGTEDPKGKGILFPFLSEPTKAFFYEMKERYRKSSALAGFFVMKCEKSHGFRHL